jgi:hypothetical protein
MPASSYHRVARLATHPAFSTTDCCLHCPRGDGAFDRVGEFNRHVLQHDLSQEEAYSNLDAKTYARLAAKHGWTDHTFTRLPTPPAVERWPVGKVLFGRLPSRTKIGDVIELATGQKARVETAKLADDLKDAKCTFEVLPDDDPSEVTA